MMLSSLLLLAAAAPQDASLHVRIPTRAADPVLEERLEALGYDVLHGGSGQDAAPGPELVVSPAERDELLRRGLPVEVLAKGRPFADILAEREANDGVPSGYLDHAAILAALAGYEASHPGLAQLVDLTATYGTPPTAEGRHLHALKISDNVALDEDEPAFLLVSAHHCRELVTPVIALDAIDRLLTGYASNPQIQAAVDGHEIWIAPVWNPDGYHHVFTVDNLWRKNRRVFPTGTGVDLNRNYPFGWSSGCSGSTNVGSSTYKGPSAASEAETETMLAWSLDRRFAKVIDFHSSGRETLWGYDCSTSPVDAFWEAEATALSQASGYGGAERRPSADGEHYQWQLATRGAIAYLTETHTQFQPSHASALAEAATVWPGILWLLARDVPVTGQVTDACSGAPLDATISYVSPTFTAGESNASGGPVGRYHAYLPAGAHTLRFEAAGYAPRDVPVSVTASGTTVVDVALDPTAGGATNFCSATANSTGLVPTLYLVGTPSLAQNQFTLFAERLPALQPATFFMGRTFVSRPVFGGVLCIGRPSYRLGPAPTDLLGLTNQTVDLAQPVHPGATVVAGDTWGFQLLYRDPAAGGSALNFSPALRVTFCP